MKPLFIPLKAEHFDAFRDRTKDTEYRVYGPRWNEKTCIPGRDVVLSRGYGKKARLRGTVARFVRFPVEGLTATGRAAFESCYGPVPPQFEAAVIQINVHDKEAL